MARAIEGNGCLEAQTALRPRRITGKEEDLMAYKLYESMRASMPQSKVDLPDWLAQLCRAA